MDSLSFFFFCIILYDTFMTERYWFLKLNLLVASFMLVLTMMLNALKKQTKIVIRNYLKRAFVI